MNRIQGPRFEAQSDSSAAELANVFTRLTMALALGVSSLIIDRSSIQPPKHKLDTSWLLESDRRPLRNWSLVDHRGETFDEYRFAGRWTVVFAGYLSCPDVCPTTMATMHTAKTLLEGVDLDVVFISVDPERDTTEDLAAYISHFDPSFIGVTGTRTAIDHAIEQLGASYRIGESPGAHYSVEHSTSLFVVDPTGDVAAYVLRPTDPVRIAADLQSAMHQGQPEIDAEIWIREAPPMASVTAGYGHILNRRDTPVTLTAVVSPKFGDIDLHTTSVDGGVATMSAMESVRVDPGETFVLAPGGNHYMLHDPGDLDSGSAPMRLIFEDGDLLVAAHIRRRP